MNKDDALALVSGMLHELAPEIDLATLEERILDSCRQRLARFAVPKQIRFVDALPKTATGKTQKAKVRKEMSG